MPIYTVEQGDYLQKIASSHGFNDYKEIYKHPENSEFRKKRPDPNIIFPGDEIYIPENSECRQYKSNQSYVIKVKKKSFLFKMQLKASLNKILSIVKYEISTDGGAQNTYAKQYSSADRHTQSLLSKGIIEEEILLKEETAVIKIWLKEENGDESFSFDVKFGHLDPPEEVTGIQSRLHSLGFYGGRIDGDIGEKTRSALCRFQKENSIDVTGEPDGQTIKMIKKHYSC